MSEVQVPLRCDRCGRRWTWNVICELCQEAAEKAAEQDRLQDQLRAARRAVSA